MKADGHDAATQIYIWNFGLVSVIINTKSKEILRHGLSMHHLSRIMQNIHKTALGLKSLEPYVQPTPNHVPSDPSCALPVVGDYIV